MAGQLPHGSEKLKRHYDVIIVGCGPSGATLANYLRLHGRSVAIFDREEDIFVAPRAMAIDAESCRIFQTIGIQERLEVADARPFTRHLFVNENRKLLLEVDFGQVEGALGYSAAGARFHQPSLERFLREDFSKGTGVDPYLGYEVEEVDGSGSSATLHAMHLASGQKETFTAEYIIGADGGGSLCRKYIASPRVDFNYSRKWIVIDILLHDQAEWDAIDDMSEFRCREDAAIVFVKGFHNHVRFDFEVTEEQAASFTHEDAINLMSEYIDTSSVEFLRMVPYHFYAGMPAEWRKGRVFVAGDAAHLTSPFSGQGLNMGIRDAANLAFKLDLVLSGKYDDRLLNTYKNERWENCEKFIQGATQRGLMISAGDTWGRFKRWFGFWVGRNAPKLGLAAMSRSSAGFPYRQGLIGTHKTAGYQFIQPLAESAGETALLDDLTGYRFVLLSRAPIVEDANLSWFRRELGGGVFHIGQDLTDTHGKLAAYFDRHELDAVLVRPDRYVFDAGGDPSALCAKLRAKLEVFKRPADQMAA